MITLHIESQDVTEVEVAAIKWLKERGYHIEAATDWETPKEICERLHIRSSFLSQALRHPASPVPLDITYGPTNRVLYLRSTPALDAFLTRHLKPKTT